MASYDVLQNNFVSGELSPLLGGRSNTELYTTGLLKCRNFMPMTPSGLRRRPGTKYLGATLSSGKARLFPMVLNDVSCIIEVNVGSARIWDVEEPSVVLAEATSELLNYPDLDAIQYATNKGVLWLACNTMPVTRISYNTTDSTLTVDKPTFTGGATFSAAGDYPSCIAFNGGRLYLGSTLNSPNTIFASRTPSGGTDRYTDFTFVETDGQVYSNNAFEAQDQDLISAYWFYTGVRFLVGSQKAVFMDTGDIATPTTFDISATLKEGSSKLPAKGLKNYVIYCSPSGKTMNLMVFDYYTQGYVSSTLSDNSSHLFASGIKNFDIAFMPDPTIWVLTNDNVLISCSVIAGSQTFTTGWAMHPQGDDGRVIESIVVGNRMDGIDVLYLIVNINGSYHIETLAMDDVLNDENYCYLDMAKSVSYGIGANRFYYDVRCAGKSIDAIGDGSALAPAVVDSEGYVNYSRTINEITMGFPIKAVVGFLSKEQPSNGASSFANKRRVQTATLRVIRSFGGTIGISDPETEGTDGYKEPVKLISRLYGDFRYNAPINLTDEDFVIKINGTNQDNGEVFIACDTPTPMNILAVKLKIQLVET